MKTSFQLSVILSCLMFFSCNNASKTNIGDASAEPKNTSNPTPRDTISQATFDQWTTLWDSLGTAYSDTSLVRYYDFPIIDMEEFLGTNAKKAFFYQGLEPLGPGKYEAHLILTGKDGSGASIGKFYDISRPCPPNCGPYN